MNNTYLLYIILSVGVLGVVFSYISILRAPSMDEEEVIPPPVVIKSKRAYKKRTPKAVVVAPVKRGRKPKQTV